MKHTHFSDDTTLGELRAYLDENQIDGAICPACDKPSKRNNRIIMGGPLRGLLKILEQEPEQPFRWFKNTWDGIDKNREMSKLRWWGLVEASQDKREDGGASGWYRMTPTCLDFITGKIPLMSHALEYRSQLLELNGKPIWIQDRIGTKFNLKTDI